MLYLPSFFVVLVALLSDKFLVNMKLGIFLRAVDVVPAGGLWHNDSILLGVWGEM